MVASIKRYLELVLAPQTERATPEGWTRAEWREAVQDLKAFRGVLAWQRVRLVTQNPFALPAPAKTMAALLLLSRGGAEIVSSCGSLRRRVGPWSLAMEVLKHIPQRRRHTAASKAVGAWLDSAPERLRPFSPANGPPVYLRSNLWFGAKVGGAFSHAAGIVNALYDTYGDVRLIGTDAIPCLHPSIVMHQIDLRQVDGWRSGSAVYFAANEGLFNQAVELAGDRRPAFVYQRCGLGDISGLRLAHHFRRPLVLEYNGPEVWVANNWSSGLPNADMFERVESELLRRADLVLAVSAPLVADAIRRGADPSRVLLSPNAVDPNRFHPGIDGANMRSRHGLAGRKVALLLSSFGPWHGVPCAIEAFAALLNRRPDLRGSVALLLAGDGEGQRPARALADKLGLTENQDVVWTGAVAADQAPELLAASDILLSPTLENPDGTVFFGSPTKLFEYMAMGKPIIASGLAQIGEVLESGRSGLLVPPGDVHALSQTLEQCFDQLPSSARLGIEARNDVVKHHTWSLRVQAFRHALEQIEANAP